MSSGGEASPAMRARGSSGVCLAVATTETFLPGALTAIGSFLKHHPGFEGDVVVIHDGLGDASRAHLEALSDRIRLEPLAPALRDRLARLPADFGPSPHRLAQLYSLEAFRLTGYRKVLFCDADLLFRQPIGELFEAPEDLICCGDVIHLRRCQRDAATFAATTAEGALDRTFNSGLLVIDERLLGERSYGGLLALVSPETWRGTDTPHTDQLVLNRYFAGRQTLVGWTYNYLLGFAGEIRNREGLAWGEAKVLHFNLPVKPWMPNALLRSPVGSVRAELLPALKLWHDAWLDSLAAAHLRFVRRQAPGGGAETPTQAMGCAR